MHFAKLRLSGFKSFVEPAEFRIEPGLTGVVGPNGCGKSNLLEALRWVMGAASAKAMRGEGMDDVIFSGAGARPPRSHAEVALTIENEALDAPGAYSASPIIEVVRKIRRGDGSVYHVNGAEARARDVQLLFADASTGANSPALVRQGQVSELIAAKPANRRRVLEEAAGVSGLHGRRHEAELKLRAAEANLERLDDLARELDAALIKLRREERAAARYRQIAADIRSLKAQALLAGYSRALAERDEIEGGRRDAAVKSQEAALQSQAAQRRAGEAAARIAPLREAETAAAAIAHALAIETDRVERDLARSAEDARRLAADIERIGTDEAREAAIAADAAQAIERFEAEKVEAETKLAEGENGLAALEQVAAETAERRARAEAALEALAATAAADEAMAKARDASAAETEARLERSRAALAEAAAALAGMGEGDEEAADFVMALEAARARVSELQGRASAARQARQEAAAREAVARERLIAAEDVQARLLSEARGLAQIARPSTRESFPAVLERLEVAGGLEAALAAALGDGLEAALDARAAAHWAGATLPAPSWPAGAEPLANQVDAPGELAAALAFIALAPRAEGGRLRKALGPGCSLVSREGDLWRWDGFTVRADARRPAQARLEQKARLAQLELKIEEAGPATKAARAEHAAAAAALEAADEALQLEQSALAQAQAEAMAAAAAADRKELEQRARSDERRRLAQSVQSLEAECAELASKLLAAKSESSPRRGESPGLRMEEARADAQAARAAAAEAESALRLEARSIAEREARSRSAGAEAARWRDRLELAERRRDALLEAAAKARKDLDAAQAAPIAAEERRQGLLDRGAEAQATLVEARDALALAESRREEADRQARTAEAAAGETRERAAALAARLEAAQAAVEHARREITGAGLSPADPAPGGSGLEDPAAIAERLAGLEGAREAIGPVNLLAEQEAKEASERSARLAGERADLAGAIARLRRGVAELNSEGRERLTAAFDIIDGHFRSLFTGLFAGGRAELRLIESDDPLEAGLEIFACPPGKRLAVMSLMSGGEQALTAVALIFAVFLANPAPICVLDEVDAPLDDANVERFCDLLSEMARRAPTRFMVITHNALTMSRMDRLFGVTMPEAGVSQLVSVDLRQAEALAAE
ncbi:MAG: chromosome segregation protein SMC [Caulobacteraceae bacterium]